MSWETVASGSSLFSASACNKQNLLLNHRMIRRQHGESSMEKWLPPSWGIIGSSFKMGEGSFPRPIRGSFFNELWIAHWEEVFDILLGHHWDFKWITRPCSWKASWDEVFHGFSSPFSKKDFQLPTPPSPVLFRIFVACVAEPHPPMDPMHTKANQKQSKARGYQAVFLHQVIFTCKILGKLLFCNWFSPGDPFFKRLMGVGFGWYDTLFQNTMNLEASSLVDLKL